MFGTKHWVPWLGLLCSSALWACSAADGDGRTDNNPVTVPLGGQPGSAGAAGAQAGVPAGRGVAGMAPMTVGPAGAPAPAVAGAPAPSGGAAGRAMGAAGMMTGAAGASGAGGITGAAGAAGPGAAGAPAAGSGGTPAGTAGMMSMMAAGETGRMVGMTAAHNAVRAMVQTTPPLPSLTWSPTLAAYAQEWADSLAKTQCNRPMHRSQQELQAKKYGENLAAAGGMPAPMTNAKWAVDGWAGEVACWTYGTFGAEFGGTEKCNMQCYQQMHSDGCGHYTAIVWRNTTEVGCGVSTCQSGGLTYDIWICNYSPPGNVVGQKPY